MLHRLRERPQGDGFQGPSGRSGVGFYSMQDAVGRQLKGRHRKLKKSIQDWAMNEARWALTKDPCPKVAAAYGLERALHENGSWLPDGAGADCYVGGDAYTVMGDPLLNARRFIRCEDRLDPIKQPDRADLRKRTAPWEEAATGGITAGWAPKVRATLFDCDAMRPPVEALALVADAFRAGPVPIRMKPDKLPPLLCIGLGWGAGAAALSIQMSAHRVFHLPVPFDAPRVAPLKWQAVVVNVPDWKSWRVMEMLGHPTDFTVSQRLKILREHHDPTRADHVPAILDLVRQHVRPGVPVAVLTACGVHQRVKAALTGDLGLQGQVVAGIDTDKRPIWVGYERRPWAPHQVPSPTGRLVSFWGAKP